MKLQEAIKVVQNVNLSTLSEVDKNAIEASRVVLKITDDPDELTAGGFADDIIAIAKKISSKPKRPFNAPKNGRLLTPKNSSKNKRGAKLISKPKPTVSTTTKKVEAVPKPKAEKPKAAKPQTPKPQTAKPKTETAAEKAEAKARAEIKILDADIARLEKRVNDNTGIVSRLAESLMEKGDEIKGTLGALPDKVKAELMMKRKKKAVLERIVKRDAGYFKSAANTLRKSKTLTAKLEADLKAVEMSISDLKDRKKPEPKPEKKGILDRIFG